MNKTLMILVFSFAYPVFADNSINLDQQQLNTAKLQIQKSGNQAIGNIEPASQVLSQIKLNQLDLKLVESEINVARPLFATKSLTNKLPDGQKYYLYSESIVSDSKSYLAQYKDSKPLDINQTISDYNALAKNARDKFGDNRLLIFISSSMPKATIVNLMRQASPLGAIFVVRGLINGSYVNTYKYFYSLKGDSNVGIMINPTLFSAMQVSRVPTFALYQSEQDLMHTACHVTPKYTSVSGEVTVHYALEQLSRSSLASLAQIAGNELDTLDAKGFYKGSR